MPFTLRLIYHSIRSAWAGVLLALIAWVGLADATPQERAALGVQVGSERPPGLVQMRVARAMVHFAPDRAARMLSEASNGEISPEFAGMLLRDLAKGPVAGQAAFDAMTDRPAARNTSRPNGAKFVPAN